MKSEFVVITGVRVTATSRANEITTPVNSVGPTTLVSGVVPVTVMISGNEKEAAVPTCSQPHRTLL